MTSSVVLNFHSYQYNLIDYDPTHNMVHYAYCQLHAEGYHGRGQINVIKYLVEVNLQ